MNSLYFNQPVMETNWLARYDIVNKNCMERKEGKRIALK